MDPVFVNPGHELDALVAEKVMGGVDALGRSLSRKPDTVDEGGGHFTTADPNRDVSRKLNGHLYETWSPSTDIAAAWEVVEHLERELAKGCPGVDDFTSAVEFREKGRFFLHGPYLKNRWRAGWLERDGEYPLITAEGETPMHAVCLVGLKAMEAVRKRSREK